MNKKCSSAQIKMSKSCNTSKFNLSTTRHYSDTNVFLLAFPLWKETKLKRFSLLSQLRKAENVLLFPPWWLAYVLLLPYGIILKP